jgi:deoxyxylulose-5-phosphate synthase
MVSLGEIEPARVTESANPGDLFTRRKGSKVAIICSGPILTAEAVKAADFYTEESCAVFSYPFINSPLTKNSMTQLNKFDKVLILENYNSGLGILKQFHDCESLQPEIFSVDVSGIPRNGWNEQVLKFHKLDAGSLVEKLRSI